MKRIRFIVLFLSTCLATMVLAPSAATQAGSQGPMQMTAPPIITHIDRTVIHGDIIHYRYDVKVGPGLYDRIRLHRIVKEVFPFRPVHTVDGILLLAGSPNYFEAMFMVPSISAAPAWDQAMAIYLAKNDIDVWGMDYRWALVPAETTDFNFMKNWGLERDVRDAETALSLARLIRLGTGQGFGKLNLLGFSWGGIVGYTAAGEETQVPSFLRNVKGIIPLDIGVELEDPNYRAIYCGYAEGDQANLDAGVYSDDTGLLTKLLGEAAVSAPNDDSAIIPGITNYQAGLLFGANPGLISGQFWHFVGGFLDENGIPSDLRYTRDRVWLDVMQNIPPHYPMKGDLDGDVVFCGKTPVPFVQHLGQIEVPILLVGAQGGFGKASYYTPGLTASKDVTKVLVQLLPDDQIKQDFGHADTVLATNAETLVWKPILDWLVAHH